LIHIIHYLTGKSLTKKLILSTNNSLKSIIKKSLPNNTDIWTKKGMSASFLGVTAHYYTHEDKQRHQVTLAVRGFSSPHTSQQVAGALGAVRTDWSISHTKVFRVLTDNGSNMVAAFKERIINRQ
jgi:hypothetical protein